MTTLLSVRGLHKSYGHKPILVDACIDVRQGEFVAVLGPSGSGKTTLFRCISRLSEPDAGQILVDGESFLDLQGSDLRRARKGIGVVFQQYNLIRRRSALRNVLGGRLAEMPLWRVLSGVYSDADLRCAGQALADVGLLPQAHQRADTLSGGQQQRVAIARALAQESRIMLADEPVASLDPATARSILSLLRQVTHAKGIALLCTLHQPDLAAEFSDRIVRMEGSRMVSD